MIENHPIVAYVNYKKKLIKLEPYHSNNKIKQM